MRKQSKSLCPHDLRENVSVENSKRRHMFLMLGGNFKFFEKILSIKKTEDPKFVSRVTPRSH